MERAGTEMEEHGTAIRSVEDADCLMARIRASATRVHNWIAAQTCDPLNMLRRMNNGRVGRAGGGCSGAQSESFPTQVA